MRLKKWWRWTVVGILALVVVAGFEHQSARAQDGAEYRPGEVVVKLAQPGDLDGVAADFGLGPTPLDQFGARAIYLLAITDGMAPPAKAAALLGDSRVLYAEPNYVQQAPEGQQRVSWARGGSAAEFAEQWAGDFLGLPAAHKITRGAGITVAVLDTGIARSHPLLAGRLAPGFDFVDMDADPSEVGTAGDDVTYGHGTHVAGLVALAAPEARILPVRVLDRNGVGNIWVLAEALAYAVNPDGDDDTADGAHIVNLSLSTLRKTNLLDEVVRDVICDDDDGADDDGDADDGDADGEDGDDLDGDEPDAALALRVTDDDDCLAGPGGGAVVVAAAGNRGSTTREYPAAETMPGLLAVGANAADGTLAAFSNRGAWVSVAAPGDRIMSSVPVDDYGVWSGTSMAAPLVAGQAALVRAANPALKAAAIAGRVRTSATPAPSGEPPRADAAAALGLARTERPVGQGGASQHRLFLPAITK
jgi:subtilisin family serine protease